MPHQVDDRRDSADRRSRPAHIRSNREVLVFGYLQSTASRQRASQRNREFANMLSLFSKSRTIVRATFSARAPSPRGSCRKAGGTKVPEWLLWSQRPKRRRGYKSPLHSDHRTQAQCWLKSLSKGSCSPCKPLAFLALAH